MKEIDLLYKELNLRYGPVLRARKCFLYTKKGVRVTDMFQENGKARSEERRVGKECRSRHFRRPAC